MKGFVYIAGVTSLCLSSWAMAQAPVEERRVSAAESTGTTPNQAMVQVYSEVQTLRQEVSELRGLIEELQYSLQQAKSQQINDYANLDNRLRQLQGTGAALPQGGQVAAIGSNPQALSAPLDAGGAPVVDQGLPLATETASEASLAPAQYSAAFGYLRSGDRQAALDAFAVIAERFPSSAEAADSLYWIGATHWVGADYQAASVAFSDLVERFPEYRKNAEVFYKLASARFDQGDMAGAQSYYTNAVALGGDYGQRAQAELASKFPTVLTP